MNELKGTDQSEILSGTPDADRILTGDGLDTVRAGAGDDQINGYLKSDSSWSYWAVQGEKLLYGEEGNDFIYAGSSNDVIDGGEGQDVLFGADGNDVLRGGLGDDSLRGQAGDDTLDGGEGNDYLSGGAGNDTYLVGNVHQYITDSSGDDHAIVTVSFAKIPSSIEHVDYIQGALPLPYWISALLSDAMNGLRTAQWLGLEKTYLYTFPSALPAYDTSSKDAQGWSAFTNTQQARAQLALDYISSVVDLHFVPSSEANALHTLSFSSNTQASTTGYAFGPSDVPGGSDLFFDNSSETPNNATFADGTHAALTLMHEIGHALGLKHPFLDPDANGNVEEPPYLTGTENATAWSVMSYNSDKAQYRLQYSPLDVAALQYLYGPNPAARAGDDSYAIDSTGPNFIWDGAGVDTLTAANCTQGCTVYLSPGYWGYVGTAKADQITAPGQITVNFGTTLENLVGSPFDDHLFGNTANNLIEGGAGNDSLDGGDGTDTAVFNVAYAQATIGQDLADYTVQTANDGVDTLHGIEFLRFTDQMLDLSQWRAGAHSATAMASSSASTEVASALEPLVSASSAQTPMAMPTSGADSASSPLWISDTGITLTPSTPAAVPPSAAVPSAVPVATDVTTTEPLSHHWLAGGEQADLLRGTSQEDVLFGAEGDDMLYGGEGGDVLQGGRSDAGQWTVVVDPQNHLLLRFALSTALPASLSSVQVQGWDQRFNGQVPDARLLAVAEPVDRLTEIALLYHAAVDALPEATWLQAMASGPLSSDSLTQLAVSHWQNRTDLPETLDDQVRALIVQVWGSASEAEVQEGVRYLEQGGSWAQGLAYLVANDRASATLRDATGALVLTQPLTLGQIGWVSGSGDDTLYGGAGNDVLVGGDGHNLLDGGDGSDLVSLVGRLADCSLQLKTTAPGTVDVLLIDRANGSENILRNIECVRLGDVVYRAKADFPVLSEAFAVSLADCVEPVPGPALALMGLPAQA